MRRGTTEPRPLHRSTLPWLTLAVLVGLIVVGTDQLVAAQVGRLLVPGQVAGHFLIFELRRVDNAAGDPVAGLLFVFVGSVVSTLASDGGIGRRIVGALGLGLWAGGAVSNAVSLVTASAVADFLRLDVLGRHLTFAPADGAMLAGTVLLGILFVDALCRAGRRQ